MKLLFVSLDFPVPANNGHRMRNWALLRALAAEGHEITLLTFTQSGDAGCDHDLIYEICQAVEVLPLDYGNVSAARDHVGRLLAVPFPAPYTVRRFRSALMTERIELLLNRNRFDAVLCETCYPLINFPVHLPIPLILDNHNVEHKLIERYRAQERNIGKKVYASLECRKLRKWEQRAWSRADFVLTCSADDQTTVQRLCSGAGTAVVPNVIDVDNYPLPASDSETNPRAPSLLYAGGMDWFPNRDAVEYFIIQILPELRLQCPGLQFVVAGRGPSDEFRRRFAQYPDVRFTGTLPDLRPEIAQATVCIVPLRIGSGTRLKILEAAAMQKPIVSTRVGAQGLEFENEKEILLADDPLDFARAAVRLLQDCGLRQQLGRAARLCVEQRYSLAVLRTRVRQALEQVLQPVPNATAERPLSCLGESQS